MTNTEKLRKHIGRLIRIKTQLWWYGERKLEYNPGRVYLLLDVIEWCKAIGRDVIVDANDVNAVKSLIRVLVLVDGLPKWIRLDLEVVEFLYIDSDQIKKNQF